MEGVVQMSDEMTVKIKRLPYLKAPMKYSDERAAVQFLREEIIIMKLAIRHKPDCSEEKYDQMTRLINAASAGFETKQDMADAEENFGVKYLNDSAKLVMNRNQYNAMCIALLTASEEMRYIDAAYSEGFTYLRDKLVKVMDGFRKKEYSLISSGDMWICYNS